MKTLKLLFLGGAASAAILALLGASAASATVLCKTNTTPCGAANHYSEGTTIHMGLVPKTKSVFETTGGFQNACSGSTIETKTQNTGGLNAAITAAVAVADITFTNCTATTQVIEGGTLEIHHISGSSNGSITAIGFKIKMNFVGMNCYYGGGTGATIGTLVGATNIITVNGKLSEVTESAVCPPHILWTATYELSLPASSIYVEPS